MSQRQKSPLLCFLWKQDPFQAKWAILARAYSSIRDSNLGNQITLDSYLAISGPLIGVISPDDYLESRGLQVVNGPDNKQNFIKTGSAIEPYQTTSTNLSEKDIVNHCVEIGYIREPESQINDTSCGSELAMAVAAQPTNQNSGVSLALQQIGSRTIIGHEIESDDMIAGTARNYNVDAINGHGGRVTVNYGLGNRYPYTAAEFNEEISTTLNSFSSVDNIGYLSLFNPELQAPVALYNPYVIQDEFDAFDIHGVSV